jgi:hypothetical protein
MVELFSKVINARKGDSEETKAGRTDVLQVLIDTKYKVREENRGEKKERRNV